MDNVRIWASEGAILDFIVRNEPKFQPYLRSGYPSLDERWKPSATNMDMIPDPAAQTVLLKKSLVQDYCMIRLLPYHPQVWIARAATFLKLGYGELATSDAYKAHLLCKAASVEEMKAREPEDGSLTAKVIGTILSKLPQSDNQSLEAYYQQIFASINRIHANAYLLMAQGLLSVSAWYDAQYVLQEAKKAFPKDGQFRMMQIELKEKITSLKETMQVHGRNAKTVKKILHRGKLERVTYPWIVSKELERGVKVARRLNAQFEAVSTNACILRSQLSGNPTREGLQEEDLGDACTQEALTTYHNAICGRNFAWLYEACKGVDKTFSDLVPLMMIKVLGTAVHLDCNPLKVPCIESLKPNNDSIVPSNFRLSYNVIAPLQILETLGVDIFSNLKFDSWALQSVIMRIEDNRVRKQTLGDLRYSIIDPLFNMFNHSCIPTASYRYEVGGTAMTVKALRDIKKGEEICISYVGPWMPEKERKDELWERVGGQCGCPSCKRERLAEEIRLRCKKEKEAEERRRALEARRRILSERAAEEGQRLVRKLRDLERASGGMPLSEWI